MSFDKYIPPSQRPAETAPLLASTGSENAPKIPSLARRLGLRSEDRERFF